MSAQNTSAPMNRKKKETKLCTIITTVMRLKLASMLKENAEIITPTFYHDFFDSTLSEHSGCWLITNPELGENPGAMYLFLCGSGVCYFGWKDAEHSDIGFYMLTDPFDGTFPPINPDVYIYEKDIVFED